MHRSRSPVASWPNRHLEPDAFARTTDGIDVACYDFGGRGPDILLVHATGFCAAVMSALAGALRDRFHCFGIDLRAHGASARPTDGDLHWRGFASDVIAAVDQLALQAPAAFGHSCGGASLLLAEESRPGTFGSLYCYEPIVFPPVVPPAPDMGTNPMSEAARRRRSSFASREEALRNFSVKPPFGTLRPDVLASYVDNGFSREADGTINLRCRREDEAEVFAQSFSHDAFANSDLVGCHVTLACGGNSDGFGPDSLCLLSDRMAASEVLVVAGLGHLGPLEDPDAVARTVPDPVAPEVRHGVAPPGGATG
jgi:pimeloyl-ACP methyl ester carboxylesterase